MISREAAICHHCNTIQNGVELVQAKAETARIALGNRQERNGRNSQAMVLLVCAIVLIVLGVAVAIWFMQSL
ncbi:MAG: hypothetical protein BMS9Abin06_0202 [Gammaproteobacteria bacterium]|nr:MAG: hypothetical protein BMS9Abin06_0202 [Gammaproteobacteria bacterium]